MEDFAEQAERGLRKALPGAMGHSAMVAGKLRLALASALGDEVLHADRLARQQEGAHSLLQFLVSQRGARALVQIIGP